MDNNTIQQLSKESLTILHGSCKSEKENALFQFAVNQNLESRMVYAVNNKPYSAAEYAAHLLCAMTQFSDTYIDSFFTLTILMALEKSNEMQHLMGYGTQLLYDLEAAHISLSRKEKFAFLAQEGTFQSNPHKARLMQNDLSVLLYCSDLFTRINLCGKISYTDCKTPDELMAIFRTGWDSGDPKTAIENMLKNIVFPSVPQEDVATLQSFTAWLRTCGFYTGPSRATTQANQPLTTLAQHTWLVISRQVALQCPQTKEEMAKIILTGVCHDLCNSMGAIKRTMEQERIYDTSGQYQEPDGRRYNIEWREKFIEDDSIPYGHGRKSVHIAAAKLGCKIFTQDMAQAVACHARECSGAEAIFAHNPLALYLHIADMFATWVDEWN